MRGREGSPKPPLEAACRQQRNRRNERRAACILPARRGGAGPAPRGPRGRQNAVAPEEEGAGQQLAQGGRERGAHGARAERGTYARRRDLQAGHRGVNWRALAAARERASLGGLSRWDAQADQGRAIRCRECLREPSVCLQVPRLMRALMAPMTLATLLAALQFW